MKLTYGILEMGGPAVRFAFENAQLSGVEALRFRKIVDWISEQMKPYLETKQRVINEYIKAHSIDGSTLSPVTQPTEHREVTRMALELAQEELAEELPYAAVLKPSHFERITPSHYAFLVEMGLATDPDAVPVGTNGEKAAVPEPVESKD